MAQRNYTTQSGDMWDGIAHKVYNGRERGEMLMHLIIEANPEHRETVVFKSGIVLAVPDAPVNIPASLPPWMR
jgi:phage tail protein X